MAGDQRRSRRRSGLRLGQEGVSARDVAWRGWRRWVGLGLLCLVVGTGSAPRWAVEAATPPLPPISALPSQLVLISPTDPILPQRAELSGYHYHHQRHRLSCEAAAVSMATGRQLSEEAILAALPYDANPWRGFRGSYNAVTRLKNGLRDYGIYALPLADELQGLGYATAVINGDQAPALLRYSVGVLKKPMVVWVTWRLRQWPAVTVGVGRERLRLILHEHARVVVGYDARRVHFLDPYDGERWDTWANFLASWALFGNMGLMVARTYPATAPLTVTGALVEHTHQAVWSWTPRQPLTSAVVTLYQAGTAVWQGQAPLTTTAVQSVVTGTQPVTTTLAVTGTQAISLPITGRPTLYRGRAGDGPTGLQRRPGDQHGAGAAGPAWHAPGRAGRRCGRPCAALGLDWAREDAPTRWGCRGRPHPPTPGAHKGTPLHGGLTPEKGGKSVVAGRDAPTRRIDATAGPGQ